MNDLQRDSPEFQAYLEVRGAVLDLLARTGAPGASAYWTEELENIDYLADATPLIVRKLRHHAFHITGIRPYDYRDKGDGRREYFEARLRALQALDSRSLLVPESPALGGFGFEIDGRLLNVDTLKFYEVLIGLERAGMYEELRRIEQPLVCEIGAGWGGFAYQFKTLFPRSTYVIVDFPELFLFSATYLRVVFPETRLRFVEPGDALTPAQWREADFVFVPNTLAGLVEGAPLDLAINMVSFQEMTGEQVRRYAAMAAASGCPRLYSLNRERSPYNRELDSVSEALATRYDLRGVALLETDYTSATKKPPKASAKKADERALGYRHYAGRLPQRGSGPGRVIGSATPAVLLGMTLYNKAGHLREAMDSLLAQTFTDFRLLLLDDASSDGTEAIAREYEARDPRVRYRRHATRQAMIATWREVAEQALAEAPEAYFAWVSDHDRWDPSWLARLVAELDAHPEAVIAYPITQRIDAAGEPIDRGARHFALTGLAGAPARWSRFCDEGVGSGDMVYGLMRAQALRQCGVFRTVLRPDRLLVAEMVLHGDIRQVEERLWFRRMFDETSIARQRQTLVLPGTAPRWFDAPPWAQHALVLYREYLRAEPAALGLGRGRWLLMITEYLWTYGRRHFRKSETSHWFARLVSRGWMQWKRLKHVYHHAVFHTLVGLRAARGSARRAARRGVYQLAVARNRAMDGAGEWTRSAWAGVRRASRRSVYRLLMLTHRLGLRGRGESPHL